MQNERALREEKLERKRHKVEAKLVNNNFIPGQSPFVAIFPFLPSRTLRNLLFIFK